MTKLIMISKDSLASPSVGSALAGTTDGPANDEGNLSDAKGLAKEATFVFQNRRFQECVEILSQIFDKKRGDAKVRLIYLSLYCDSAVWFFITLLLQNTFEMIALILGISLMH
ncbi:hypothetical protein ZIOFF_015043 [Zingiber officinale]|uniref:Uncharacterized protein n=1 Tax=Zingiber officinale TaxID=94328 RepID=A0A8J5LW05_ZINOF|nr:hypothetical protein ZIOFF_015043 [Zingiber officinale]